MSEKLSNILDKHVTESELDEFLRACRDDPSLIDKWQRYHVAGAVIRNEIDESDIKFDVSAKVMAGLDGQQFDSSQQHDDDSNVISLTPAVEREKSTPPPESKSRMSRPWLPMALAASMLLGLYFIFQQPVLENKPQEVQVADNVPVGNISSVPVDHWQASSREIEDALNTLLVEHSEFTSVTGMNGLGSYSKFIAYQN